MNIQEISLKELLKVYQEEGMLSLLGQRVLMLDAVALGILRKELIETFGLFGARTVLTRFGYAHGWRTAEMQKEDFPTLFADPHAGAHLHKLCGLVQPFDFSCSDGNDGRPLIETCLRNSYEAEQHLLHLGPSEDAICWTLTGFASGYECFKQGKEVYFIEDKCCGKGDDICHIVGRFKEQWGDELTPHLQFYSMTSADAMLRALADKLKYTETKLKRKRQELERIENTIIDIPSFIIKSEEMRRVINTAKRIAQVDTSVVITGESGVGKERVSRFIHDQSPRASKPFLAINCGAIAETLLESELFGHSKGSFTGADRDRVGLFEEAEGGTLFLDEIGEITAGMQVKLLRVLQEKEIKRVGENKPRPINVRIIAATNRNLADDVHTGRFRQDLYYRLCVIELAIPALRNRQADILPLAKFFLQKASNEAKRNIDGLSPKAMERLLSYCWPGNVRELYNVMEQCVALCENNTIDFEDLPSKLKSIFPKSKAFDDILSLEEVEKAHIVFALELTRGNKKIAAKKLNIATSSLYRKLHDYGINAIRPCKE